MKLTHIKNIIFLLCMLCIISFEYECAQVFKASSDKFPQLQTGHLSIRPPKNPSKYVASRVTLKSKHIKEKLDVGLSITYMSNYFNDKDVDFSIRPLVKQTYFDTVLSMGVNTRWTSVHVHWVASSRDDFKCGTFVAGQNSLLQTTGPQGRQIVLSHRPFTNDWQKVNGISVKTYYYINGIKSEDANFNLRILPNINIINRLILIFVVELSNNKKPIQQLYISYMTILGMSQVSVEPYPPSYDFRIKSLKREIDQYGTSGMTGFYGLNLQNLHNITGQYYKTKNPKRLLSNNIPIPNKPDPVPPKPNKPPSESGSDDAQAGSTGTRTVTGSVAGSTQRSETAPPNWYEQRLKQDFPSITQQLKGRTDQLQQQIRGMPIYKYYQNIFNMTDYKFNLMDQAPPLFRSTYVQSKIKNMIEKNVCINFDSCKQNNGVITILKGQEKPSCVICAPDKVFNQQKQQCQCREGFFQSDDKCIESSVFCGKQNVFQNGTCFSLVKSKSFCQNSKNQVFDQNSNKCVCAAGTTQTQKGTCLNCSPYATINKEKDICECLPGYTGNGKICRGKGGATVFTKIKK